MFTKALFFSLENCRYGMDGGEKGGEEWVRVVSYMCEWEGAGKSGKR